MYMSAHISRRTLLGSLAVPCLFGAVLDPAYKLIAHRGGIVDDNHPENSPGSLQAAIDRGYWMAEVDIRWTRDGEPFLLHDDNFQRFYRNPAKAGELTWAEASRLRSSPGGHKPIHFEEACGMCEGKIRMMLDIKLPAAPREAANNRHAAEADWPAEYYERLGNIMEQHHLLKNAYMLGGGSHTGMALRNSVRQSANTARLRAAIERGEDVKSRYFFFELASEITPEKMTLCRKAEVTPVAAINTFRYTMAKRDEWEGPKEDAASAKAIGIQHFQIDSRYEPFFRTA